MSIIGEGIVCQNQETSESKKQLQNDINDQLRQFASFNDATPGIATLPVSREGSRMELDAMNYSFYKSKLN